MEWMEARRGGSEGREREEKKVEAEGERHIGSA